MPTQKIAITIPKNLVAVIDEISRLKGVPGNSFISAFFCRFDKYESRDQ